MLLTRPILISLNLFLAVEEFSMGTQIFNAMDTISRECGKITDPSEARPLTLYVKCSTAELLGHAFKQTPKAESFTFTAPLFYQLHRGANVAPLQSAENLKSERGLQWIPLENKK